MKVEAMRVYSVGRAVEIKCPECGPFYRSRWSKGLCVDEITRVGTLHIAMKHTKLIDYEQLYDGLPDAEYA